MNHGLQSYYILSSMPRVAASYVFAHGTHQGTRQHSPSVVESPVSVMKFSRPISMQVQDVEEISAVMSDSQSDAAPISMFFW